MNKSPKKTEFTRIKIVITVISLIFIVFVIYLSYFQVFKAKIADNPYNQRLTAYERDIERGKFLTETGSSCDEFERCHESGYPFLSIPETLLSYSRL